MRAIRDMGYSVPEDISVIGYDGIESSRYTIPRLTTIRQDIDQMSKKGVKDIIRRINYPESGINELIGFQMIEGESVAHLE